MRALSTQIFKSYIGDCSNGGISSKYKEILLLCDRGDTEIDINNIPENLCKIVKTCWNGHISYHVEPVKKPEHIGWMAGGCIVYAYDSRYPFDYPLRLHDRQETQEQYNMLSD